MRAGADPVEVAGGTTYEVSRSIVWLAFYNLISWLAMAALGLASSTFIYRFVGAETYGIWATILALRSVGLWLDGGLAMGVIRDGALLATDDGAARRIRSAQLAYRGLGAVLIVLGVAASSVPVGLLGLSGQAATVARWATVLLAVDAGITLAGSPLTAVLRGLQRFDLLAVGSIAHATLGISFLVIGLNVGGLIGASIGLVIARTVVTLGYGIWMQRSHPDLLGMSPSRQESMSVLRFAGPLWLISFGTLLSQSTDVPVVGYFFGAASAGYFAVGAIPPSVLVGALWLVVDTMFPRLVAAGTISIPPLRLLLLAATFMGGMGLTLLAINADPVLRVWIGNDPPLAARVMVVYSATWLLNMPVHVLALAAIARNRHQIVAPVVIAEAAMNLVLSIALAMVVGPVGPALGTLLTVAVSNVLVLPWLLLRRMDLPIRVAFQAAGVGLATGISAGAAIGLGAVWLSPNDVLRITISAALPTALVGVLAVVWVRSQDDIYRIAGLVLDRGAALAMSESGEVRMAAESLRKVRAISEPNGDRERPLVTVRIATFNRGQVVADRAIASALRQTYEKLEILVVGDRCDSATEAAVRSIEDPRVVFHNLDERGQYPKDPTWRWMVAGSTPMNWALDHARGAWIAPLDDDDEFTPDHVEVLLSAALKSRAEFVYGIADAEVEPGVWRPIGSWPLRRGHIIHAAVMYRADLRFMKHSEQSWRLHEPSDWNLWNRMRRAGVEMTFVDRVVVRHHIENRDVRGIPSGITAASAIAAQLPNPAP